MAENTKIVIENNTTEQIIFDYLGNSVNREFLDGITEIVNFTGSKKKEKIQSEAAVLGFLAVGDIDEVSTTEIVEGTGLKALDVNRAVRQLDISDVYKGLVNVVGGQQIKEGKTTERRISLQHPIAVSSRWYSPKDHKFLGDALSDTRKKKAIIAKETQLRTIKSAARLEIAEEEQGFVDRIRIAAEGLELPTFIQKLEGNNSGIYRVNPGETPELVYLSQEDASDERMEERVQGIMVALRRLAELPVGETLSMMEIKDEVTQTSNTSMSEVLANIKRKITNSRKSKKWNDSTIASDLTQDVPGKGGKRGSSGIKKVVDFTVLEV